MEIHQLECFVKTAELGSFTKASQLLHISQSALSKNIALLEKTLGVNLFDRTGKRFSLSVAGKKVLVHSQTILDEAQRIELLCQAEKTQNEPVTLRMMCADDLFPRILKRFRQSQPDIRVTLLPTIKTTSGEDSDILVFATRDAHHSAAFRSVLCEEIRLLVPPDHPLYHHEDVTLSELAEYSIISLRELTDLRTLEDYYFDEAGVKPRRDIICDNPAALQSVLKLGVGIAMVPTVTWDVVSGTENRLLPIRGKQCIRYINVHLPNPKHAGKNVQTLFEHLILFFSEMSQPPEEHLDSGTPPEHE